MTSRLPPRSDLDLSVDGSITGPELSEEEVVAPMRIRPDGVVRIHPHLPTPPPSPERVGVPTSTLVLGGMVLGAVLVGLLALAAAALAAAAGVVWLT